ncbi:hypothetical protein F5B19DRAFT_502048 [Rostrohypoxylon terebratum]|nr:hypothetical protein F5B19DRAFT_502048 [Rostrohypoxylon terebratum]
MDSVVIALNDHPLDVQDDRNRPSSPDPSPNDDTASTSSLDPQDIVDQFEWTENNLPIGISFRSRSRLSTPGFMKERTDIPIKREEREASIVEIQNPQEPVESPLRRSSRNFIKPRTPFPSEIPIWAILATDFRLISDFPDDIAIWYPSCERKLPKETFRINPTSEFPVETCLDCREGRRELPPSLAICWNTPSDGEEEGCGRLLPNSHFSSIYDREIYTGVFFCRDCRAVGHTRARLEGRYNEAK